MAHRTFTDRNSRQWAIRERSRTEWEFEPIADNPEHPRMVAAPSYERDPYELSQEELQRLLDESGPLPERRAKSPFKD